MAPMRLCVRMPPSESGPQADSHASSVRTPSHLHNPPPVPPLPAQPPLRRQGVAPNRAQFPSSRGSLRASTRAATARTAALSGSPRAGRRSRGRRRHQLLRLSLLSQRDRLRASCRRSAALGGASAWGPQTLSPGPAGARRRGRGPARGRSTAPRRGSASAPGLSGAGRRGWRSICGGGSRLLGVRGDVRVKRWEWRGRTYTIAFGSATSTRTSRHPFWVFCRRTLRL